MKRQYVMTLLFMKENDIKLFNIQGVSEFLQPTEEENVWIGEDGILTQCLALEMPSSFIKDGFSLSKYMLTVLLDINNQKYVKETR